jgi:hypothetical protein
MKKLSGFLFVCLLILLVAEVAVFLRNKGVKAELLTKENAVEYKDYLEEEWVKIPDKNKLPDPFRIDAKKAAELVKLYFPEDLTKIQNGMKLYDNQKKNCFIVLYRLKHTNSMKKVVIDKSSGAMIASYRITDG